MKHFVDGLRMQHLIDLKVYQSAHKERRNIMLHKILIPVECWSAMLFVWIFFEYISSLFIRNHESFSSSFLCNVCWILPRMIALLLGVLSLIISTKPIVGVMTFIFHLFIIYSYDVTMTIFDGEEERSLWPVLIIATTSWCISWIIQVGIGHFYFERNLPNILSKDDIMNNSTNVSYLSMCQSVLIAWRQVSRPSLDCPRSKVLFPTGEVAVQNLCY